jgi:hypothetical protein
MHDALCPTARCSKPRASKICSPATWEINGKGIKFHNDRTGHRKRNILGVIVSDICEYLCIVNGEPTLENRNGRLKHQNDSIAEGTAKR